MLVEFSDSDFYVDITLSPENIAELAKLFRLVRNAKAQKPFLHLTFSGDKPSLSIGIQKVKREKQINSISK